MSADSVVKALVHVVNNLDIGNQWKRAVNGLKSMSALEKARVWVEMSSSLKPDQVCFAVLFSQYKTAYKRAVREAEEGRQAFPCLGDCQDDEAVNCYVGKSDFAFRLLERIANAYAIVDLASVSGSTGGGGDDGDIVIDDAARRSSTPADKILDSFTQTTANQVRAETGIQQSMEKYTARLEVLVKGLSEKNARLEQFEKRIDESIAEMKLKTASEATLINDVSQIQSEVKKYGETLNEYLKANSARIDAMCRLDDKNQNELKKRLGDVESELGVVKSLAEMIKDNMEDILENLEQNHYEAGTEPSPNKTTVSMVDEHNLPPVRETMDKIEPKHKEVIKTRQTITQITRGGFLKESGGVIFFYHSPLTGARLFDVERKKVYASNKRVNVYEKAKGYSKYISDISMSDEISSLSVAELLLMENQINPDPITKSIAQNGIIFLRVSNDPQFLTYNPVTGTPKFMNGVMTDDKQDKEYPEYITIEAWIESMKALKK